jgi:hypothetical protein
MRALVLLALCACNGVFGIDGTKLEPDAPTIDSDGDGVSDLADNCARVPNPNQADEDRDGFGNACDNCPILPNADQQDIGDADGIGDRCDPHPTVRDCLIAFDSFDDPDHFLAHWAVTPQTTQGMAMPTPGGVVISSPQAVTLAIELRDDSGQPVLGKHDVQLVAQFPVSSGLLLAASNVSNGRTGLWCGVGTTSLVYVMTPDSGPTVSAELDMYSPPLDDNLYLRNETTNDNGGPVVACTAEYGISLRSQSLPVTAVATGSPAAIILGGTATVTGFTAYRNASSTSSCPTPLIR